MASAARTALPPRRRVLRAASGTSGTIVGVRGEWFTVEYDDRDRDDVEFDDVLPMITRAQAMSKNAGAETYPLYLPVHEC